MPQLPRPQVRPNLGLLPHHAPGHTAMIVRRLQSLAATWKMHTGIRHRADQRGAVR